MSTRYHHAASLLVAGLSATVLVGCGGGGGHDHDASPAPTIEVLSSKAEHVTGGDALIAIRSSGPDDVKAILNGNDISSVFEVDPGDPTRLVGILGGLDDGANTFEASAGGAMATLTLTNYPVTGPMLSGPHQSPFICQTEAFVLPDGTNLGVATDADCSAPTQVHYVYRTTTTGDLVPMPDITTPPGDVAMTTNSLGVTVPFIVRVETGTMNRGIYQNAVLHDPTSDAAPSPVAPPKGWNRRLIANHGSGCTGGWYVQGDAMGADLLTGDNLTRLGEGYAIFINTLNHPTNSCNATLAGETTMMGKEHFIETFGVPHYTVSTGCSGGAYTSLQVADAFPGLFDGVAISCTYPDALTIAMSALDSKLLSRYLLSDNVATFTEEQMTTVSGHKTARAWYDLALQSGRTDPVPGRIDPLPASPLLGGYNPAVWNAAVPVGLRYDPTTNPTGVRPTVFDAARSAYGVDLATGFALRPFDNIGVQYGLAALNAGTITPEQFLDLNERIGGYDYDGNYTTGRTVGDAGAIARAYQGGLLLGGGGGLASIPVFDYTGIYDDDQFYHYQWFHFAVRERMARANGNADNHVMWRGGAPITALFGFGTPVDAALTHEVASRSWAEFIKWVEAYKGDASTTAQRDKVIAHKPDTAVDGCFTQSLTPEFIAEPQTLGSEPDSQCNTLYPSWTAPRIEAGSPVAADALKCQLKPVAASDYDVTFTAQEMTRLNAIFPQGVCDWTKEGIEQTPVVPYASFGPSPVNQVFDITTP